MTKQYSSSFPPVDVPFQRGHTRSESSSSLGYIVIGEDVTQKRSDSEEQTSPEILRSDRIKLLKQALREEVALNSQEEEPELSPGGAQGFARSSSCETNFVRFLELQEKLAEILGVKYVFDPRGVSQQTEIPGTASNTPTRSTESSETAETPREPRVIGAQGKSDDFRRTFPTRIPREAPPKDGSSSTSVRNVSAQTNTKQKYGPLERWPVRGNKEEVKVQPNTDQRTNESASSFILVNPGRVDQNVTETCPPGTSTVRQEGQKPLQIQNEFYQNICELCQYALPLSQEGTLTLSGYFYHRRCVLDVYTCKELYTELQHRCLQRQERRKKKTMCQRAVKKIKKMFQVKHRPTKAQKFSRRK